MRFTPYFGVAVIIFGLILLARNQSEKLLILILAIVTVAFITPKTKPEKTTYWSPYQKLSLSIAIKDSAELKPQPEGWYLEVNNVGYMALLDLSDKYKAKAKKELDSLFQGNLPLSTEFADHYYLPFYFKPQPKNILIIGAGAGNDAAAAVRLSKELAGSVTTNKPEYKQLVPTIDAVEIDPTIIEIGKIYHPEKPYQEPNVNAIIDDGRSFIQKTNKKYDIVIMGLADSHTLSSSLTNLRLDHYLYTEESFQRIKEILNNDGMLFLTFEAARPWIGDRLNKGLTDVFGQAPKIFEVRSGGVYGWGGYSFVVAKNKETLQSTLANNQDLERFVSTNEKKFDINVQPLTDNWPYLYLDKPRIPIIHLIVAVVVGSFMLLLRKRFLGTGVINLPMFFWGAAFLLFEFQNVSKTSLLFGITWVTNLFTISAILILLLVANWTVQKKLISPRTAFVFLILTLILQIVIPLRILNNFTFWQKIIFANLLLNLPVFFGGIIFTNMFAKSKNKAIAFGSNFLGSVLGGFAEMLSFLFGIHSLLYIVIIFYTLGFAISKFIKLPKIKLTEILNIPKS